MMNMVGKELAATGRCKKFTQGLFEWNFRGNHRAVSDGGHRGADYALMNRRSE
jgi:hypothetical protein